ncbi:hypothetical protein YC2023_082819 [Brassica napus]
MGDLPGSPRVAPLFIRNLEVKVTLSENYQLVKRSVLVRGGFLGDSELGLRAMVSDAPPEPPGSPARVLDEKEMGDEGSSVGNSDPVVGAKPIAPSWVSVAQDKRVLKKYEVEISNKDGLNSVEIPDDVLASSTPLWEDFIVGKFLDISPHVAKVHMVLNKIWKYGEVSAKVEVFEVNATTMRFRVANPKAREKILKRGMWNIVGVPMVVSKWSPRSEEEKQEEEATPMWVHLRGVPLHMYSWEGLGFITSVVGFPAKLHPETVACTNFEVAKVFAKVDVSKPLPKEIKFKWNGKEFVVGFHFPWLPTKCRICDKWGHAEEVCSSKGKETEGRDEIRSVAEDVRDVSLEILESGKAHQEVVVTGSKREDEETHQAVAVVEKNLEIEMIHKEPEKPRDEVIEVNGEIQKEGTNLMERSTSDNWYSVSPTKVGRSPVNPFVTQREDSHISASKVSVLSVGDEEEGEILQDRELVECDATDMGNDEAGQLEEDFINQQCANRKLKGKKAKSQDANPRAMSTRSSRRHH